jgi:hypothetical protein
LVFCGDVEQANAHMERALAVARFRREPTSVSTALSSACRLALWQDRPDDALRLADELLSPQHPGIPPVMLAHARLLRHWALCRLGLASDPVQVEAGVQAIHRLAPAMDGVSQMLVADAACAREVPLHARDLIERALALGEACGHVHYHAELKHLLAKWHHRHGEPAQALLCLQSADALAIAQGNAWTLGRLANTRQQLQIASSL